MIAALSQNGVAVIGYKARKPTRRPCKLVTVKDFREIYNASRTCSLGTEENLR